MNKQTLKLISVVIVTNIFSSCSNKSVDIDNEFNDLSKMTSTWVCNPESDVTITLNFESGQAYVNTSPQDLSSHTMQKGIYYLFLDGDQYIVRNDTLFFVDTYAPDAEYGFVGTLLSSDRMRLQPFGVAYVDFGTYIKDYLFERKKN